MNTTKTFVNPLETKNSNINSNMQKVNFTNNKNLQHENELLVVLFYGVSCMGKTTFAKMVQQEAQKKQINFKKVSLDAIGGPVLKKFKEDNPDITDNEEVFFNCWAKIAALFKDQIFEEISKCKPGKNLLFIDDGKLEPTILQKLESPDLLSTHNVKLLAIYPKKHTHFEVNNETFIPFSPQLILNLCIRCLTREAHETMDYIPEKLLQIVISFTILYSNVDCFKSHFLTEAKFTEMLEIPFHQEKHIHHEDEEKTVLCDNGKKHFDEFQLIMKNVYENIKAPFESLKTAEIKHLTELKEFLADEYKIGTLKNLINYAGKGDWISACEKILNHFTGMDEFQKENNMNRGN